MALTIGSMVLVAVITVYSRAERAAAAVIQRLDNTRLPMEVLQRIAEDLDRAVAPGSQTKITVQNKFEQGFRTARLTIERTFTDETNKQQLLEQIIWQASFDVESQADGLVLYRCHKGLTVEDKLLDEQRAEWEKDYPFVPICQGVTLFQIQIPSGGENLEAWTSDTLPRGLVVSISFAKPFETARGTFDVLPHQRHTRTIAIDRTRKIRFDIFASEQQTQQEPSKNQSNVPLQPSQLPRP